MAKFTVTYDDFSGGLWVGGRSASKQPKNTWTGVDLIGEHGTGYLLPTGGWTSYATYNYKTPLAAANGYAWYADNASSTVGYFVVPQQNSSPGPPSSVASVGHPPSTVLYAGVVFDDKFVIPEAAATNVLVAAVGDTNTTVVATPAILNRLAVYDSWVVGYAGNRIYYCDAYDPTSWPSANYYDVGSPSSVISAFVQHSGALYVATSSGWWIGSGIPGETFSLRHLTSHAIGNGAAVDADVRILYTAPDRSVLNELAGIVVSPVLHVDISNDLPNFEGMGPVRFGPYVIVGDGTYWYFFDVLTRTWFSRTAPTTALPPNAPAPVTAAVFASDGTTIYKVDPQLAGTTESTALLAEYMHRSKFRVREVFAEVEMLGSTGALKFKALTPGHPDMAIATASAAGSTEQTYSITGATAGQVGVYRFEPTDHPPAFLVQPQVKLTGVKLRRLILVCEET